MSETSSARWWALGATALSLLVVGLDMTVLNVALPDIATDLGASTSQLQWFADAYLLVLAAVMLPAGMLGDRFGRKGLTVGALVVFGLGSLWCAYADSPASLIAARSVLGLGAAALIPLAMSAVVVLFEPEERPKAVLVLSLSTMVGLPLGPIVGGALLQSFWWGSVFIINVPVIAAALVAVVRFLPAGGVEQESRGFDGLGVVLAATGLVAVTYGVIEGPNRGWTDPVTLACLVGGVVVLAAFLVWERRLTGTIPVFDYDVWAHPAFRWGSITAAVASMSLFGVFFTMPQYFRLVLGADALGTGLRTLPLVMGMLVAMQLSNRVGSRVPAGIMAAAGSLLVAVGMVVGATTGAGRRLRPGGGVDCPGRTRLRCRAVRGADRCPDEPAAYPRRHRLGTGADAPPGRQRARHRDPRCGAERPLLRRRRHPRPLRRRHGPRAVDLGRDLGRRGRHRRGAAAADAAGGRIRA